MACARRSLTRRAASWRASATRARARASTPARPLLEYAPPPAVRLDGASRALAHRAAPALLDQTFGARVAAARRAAAAADGASRPRRPPRPPAAVPFAGWRTRARRRRAAPRRHARPRTPSPTRRPARRLGRSAPTSRARGAADGVARRRQSASRALCAWAHSDGGAPPPPRKDRVHRRHPLGPRPRRRALPMARLARAPPDGDARRPARLPEAEGARLHHLAAGRPHPRRALPRIPRGGRAHGGRARSAPRLQRAPPLRGRLRGRGRCLP